MVGVKIVPRGVQGPQKIRIVVYFSSETVSKGFAALLGSIWSRNNVMETTVQDDLHAAIDLCTCDGTRLNLLCNTRMHTRL
jgi:hypothetical protein